MLLAAMERDGVRASGVVRLFTRLWCIDHTTDTITFPLHTPFITGLHALFSPLATGGRWRSAPISCLISKNIHICPPRCNLSASHSGFKTHVVAYFLQCIQPSSNSPTPPEGYIAARLRAGFNSKSRRILRLGTLQKSRPRFRTEEGKW